MVINEERPPAGERRELLLNVARKVFADRGYQATTMDDIAKEAGFTKPILYQFFDSKLDLYREIVSGTAQGLIDALAKLVPHAQTPRSKIEIAFSAYFDMVVSQPDAFRILFIHSHEGEIQGELRKVEITLVSFIEPFIDVSISDEHRIQLAAGVVGIAEGTAVVWLEQQAAKGWPTPADGAAERLAARSATLAWGGLRTVHQD